MGMIECTSNASLWRGYDYYKENKVKNLIETSQGIFTADVEGTSAEPYAVEIDIKHPRKSKCNCPFADGRLVVCKHMMATYFAAFPHEAQRIYDEAVAYEEEAELYEEEICDNVRHYVQQMKKHELEQVLIDLLFNGPDWQFEDFVNKTTSL